MNIELPLLIVGVIFGLLVGAFCATAISNESWRKEAIARGVGEYNRTTGQWEWVSASCTKQKVEDADE